MFNNAPAKRWLSEPDDPRYRNRCPQAREGIPAELGPHSQHGERDLARERSGGRPRMGTAQLAGVAQPPRPLRRISSSSSGLLSSWYSSLGRTLRAASRGEPASAGVRSRSGWRSWGLQRNRLCGRPQPSRAGHELHRPFLRLHANAGTHRGQWNAPAGRDPIRCCLARERRGRCPPTQTTCSWRFCPVATGIRSCGSRWSSMDTRSRRAAPSTLPVPPALTVPQTRAPDPDGGAPWGYAAGADGISAYGRIVNGRLAGISEREGAVRNGPMGSGGRRTLLRPSPQPSVPVCRSPPARGPLRSAGRGCEGPSEGVAPALTPPQIERRTLEGHTIITGADVQNPTWSRSRWRRQATCAHCVPAARSTCS